MLAKIWLLGIAIICSITLLNGCSNNEKNVESYTVDPKASFAIKERINKVIGTEPKQIIVNNEEVDLEIIDWELNQDKVNNLLSNVEITATDKADGTPHKDKTVHFVYDNIQFIIPDGENGKIYAVSGDIIVELKGNIEADIKGIKDWLNK